MAGGSAEAKRRMRAELALRRRRVDPGRAQAAAEAVAAAVVGQAGVRAAPRVALYAAFGGELPSRPLFEGLAGLGIPRLLPRVRGEALEWAELQDWDALVPAGLGGSEPPGPVAPSPGPGELVLLPGLAFDERGWRLGRGGGHYDRAFPPGAEAPVLVGVGYAFQCVDAVPHDSRDRRVDAIVSERGWCWRTEVE